MRVVPYKFWKPLVILNIIYINYKCNRLNCIFYPIQSIYIQYVFNDNLKWGRLSTVVTRGKNRAITITAVPIKNLILSLRTVKVFCYFTFQLVTTVIRLDYKFKLYSNENVL